MHINLEGWQRVGIAVSVVWFIGFLFVGDYSTRWFWYSYGIEKSVCEEKFGITWKDESKSDIDASRAGFEKCRTEARNAFLGAIGKIVAKDLGAIVLGWLVAWLGIVAMRRVRRADQ
ncbi:MAG: hypothetical protein ACLP1D_13465 [Xanthobacteraceae bacterium]